MTYHQLEEYNLHQHSSPFRYFEIEDSDGSKVAWFGGGTDLTPYIYNEDDFVHFHQTLKDACDKHSDEHYKNYKKWSVKAQRVNMTVDRLID